MRKQLISLEAAMGELRRGERLQIMLSDGELTAVDDWRFGARMPSRAAAIRELLRRGLAAEGVMVANEGNKSKNYGVLDEAKPTKAKARAK
jgi:hypothetical protein